MWVGGALLFPPTCVCGVDAGAQEHMRIGAGTCVRRCRARWERVSEGASRSGKRRATLGGGRRRRAKRLSLREETSEGASRARKRARMLRVLAGGEARGSPSVRPGRRALPTAPLARPGRDRVHRPRCWRTRCLGRDSSARGSRPRRGVRPRDESRARIG